MGRTDGRTFDRCINLAPRTMRAVPMTHAVLSRGVNLRRERSLDGKMTAHANDEQTDGF